MDIKEKIKNLPEEPGVYILKDKEGKAIYIGKATSLRKRVASHFHRLYSPKEEILQKKTADIEYIPTANEAEALLWEAALIKEKQPLYNINYRDDKSYPFLKITINENFPRIFIGRRKEERGILYFGPYSNIRLLKEALKIIRKIFPFRSCRILPKKPCLYYSLKLCPGPCIEAIEEKDYKEIIRNICLLLEGEKEELEKELIEKMGKEVEEQNFERAALIRDQLKGLSQLKSLRWGVETIFEELRDTLNLKRIPYRIEAFDLSHLSGKEAVGAMVSFYKGMPDKNNYRRFKIKLSLVRDDFSMLREVIYRRFKRLIEERKEFPDLVLLDGGKGHLETAFSELKKLGITMDLIALEKGEEKIYILNKKEPLRLPLNSHVLQFLQRVRDEAHRFAITYHKKLRKKSVRESELDNIKGIGEKRRRALLNFFGSVEMIKQANLEELLKIRGMNRRVAQDLINYFKLR
ncbi:MAG: excinuclease ABC subunit UvrC [Candidatus Omnitrophica bacterium]|nr:excinuclease ABC subunit UvrC [Candidatus Omnitrophota bacterium]MCM8793402.1 excinuclease ABC subunit UvrC [Candidatus Omnitrophota bacterium]